jgi:hypothetical protein
VGFDKTGGELMEPCYTCGEREYHESMPHGNHTDWLAFAAMAVDPNDLWGTSFTQSRETARQPRLYRDCRGV